MDGRRRKTVDADAAAGGTSEGRQPLVDVHGVHVRDAHVAIVRRPHVRAIGHANRAYEVFRRYTMAAPTVSAAVSTAAASSMSRHLPTLRVALKRELKIDTTSSKKNAA